jgi:transcriptional repressor NrdR
VEETPRLVLKKDQRREAFSRQKILSGLLRACEKRPVSVARLEEVVDLVERKINEKYDQEVPARAVGEIVVGELKRIDAVAYVRFASVYEEFTDVSEFMRELTPLIEDTVGEDAVPFPGEKEGGGDPESPNPG